VTQPAGVGSAKVESRAGQVSRLRSAVGSRRSAPDKLANRVQAGARKPGTGGAALISRGPAHELVLGAQLERKSQFVSAEANWPLAEEAERPGQRKGGEKLDQLFYIY